MYWENENALIVSDLHLGKTGHFRKEGIAVPQQVYQQDLHRLFDTIRFFNPREVLLTGDLFHSRSNLEWDWFGRLRNELTQANFTLIVGNHDRFSPQVAVNLNLSVCHYLIRKDILFVHNSADSAVISQQVKGIVCGHVHPAVKVPTGIRQLTRLPCFHFSPYICTLPAFSLFTGTHIIKPKKNDRIFSLTAKEVIEVTGI